VSFYKAYEASGQRLAAERHTVLHQREELRQAQHHPGGQAVEHLGFQIVSTDGTGAVLKRNGIAVGELLKVSEAGPMCWICSRTASWT